MSIRTLEPVPPEVWAEICAADDARLKVEPGYTDSSAAVAGYCRDYAPDCPGYCGPIVLVVWRADPGAVAVFYAPDGKWTHLNSTSW